MTVQKPRLALSFPAHKGGTTSASFARDGKTLATGGYDGIIRLWDVFSWQETQALPGHRRGHVAFSPDGRLLLSGGLHADAVVRDTSTWREVATLAASDGVWALAFRPDGSEAVLIGPDGLEEQSRRPIKLREPRGWTLKGTVDVGEDNVYAVAFSPDGGMVALSYPPRGMVSLWSGDFARNLVSFTAHQEATWGTSFSRDGGTLATGGGDNVARLWDTTSWRTRCELTHGPARGGTGRAVGVLCVAFSPDGDLLVTGGLDGALSVWETNSMF